MNPLNQLKIAICSDHAGYELKGKLKDYLQAKNVLELKDFGAFSPESSDYPDFAHPMAEAVEKGKYDFGVSICGSGNGISMTVNKHAGIRAALSWTSEIARLGRLHNDANVLSLPARFITEEDAYKTIDAFFSTDFEGGRHQRRINKIPC